MTGVVYETQHRINPNITNYADALYFTVTALTTTGFGDITLPGTLGRLITVVIMIFGVTLFLISHACSSVRARCALAVRTAACNGMIETPFTARRAEGFSISLMRVQTRRLWLWPAISSGRQRRYC